MAMNGLMVAGIGAGRSAPPIPIGGRGMGIGGKGRVANCVPTAVGRWNGTGATRGACAICVPGKAGGRLNGIGAMARVPTPATLPLP